MSGCVSSINNLTSVKVLVVSSNLSDISYSSQTEDINRLHFCKSLPEITALSIMSGSDLHIDNTCSNSF